LRRFPAPSEAVSTVYLISGGGPGQSSEVLATLGSVMGVSQKFDRKRQEA
jgi:hypothetical protein